MTYSVDNPPALHSQGVGGYGRKYLYDSPDPATEVRADGYISDAADLGMKVGDTVEQFDSAGGTISHKYVVAAINADGSADLSDGSATSVTNT